MSSERHGAEKESMAESLYLVAWAALRQAGLPPKSRVQLVIDQSHIDGNPEACACFGSIPIDRLQELIGGAINRQRGMQTNAVSALAKYTLSGQIRHPLNGENHNG